MAGIKIAPDGIRAWNPAFDVTPGRLITAIVTDKGVLWRREGIADNGHGGKAFDVKAFCVPGVDEVVRPDRVFPTRPTCPPPPSPFLKRFIFIFIFFMPSFERFEPCNKRLSKYIHIFPSCNVFV